MANKIGMRIALIFFIALLSQKGISQQLIGVASDSLSTPKAPAFIKQTVPIITSDSCENNTYYVRYNQPYVYVYSKNTLEPYIRLIKKGFNIGARDYTWYADDMCLVFRIGDTVAFEAADIKTILTYFICN